MSHIFEPTGIQQFTFCPWKYYLDKILGEKPAYISPSLVRGRIGHDVLTHGIEMFDGVFDSAMAYYTSPSFSEAMQPLQIEEKDVEKMREDLRLICQNTMAVCRARQTEFLYQEKTLGFKLEYGGVVFDFEGTIDAIATNISTPSGYVEIIDWKFGRKQSDEQMMRNLQHGLYYYAMREHGYNVQWNSWVHVSDFLPFKRDTKMSKKGDLRGPGFYPIVIRDEDIPYITEQVGRICLKIKRGEFTQNAYGPNAPCPFCEYRNNPKCPRFVFGTQTRE